MCRNRQHHHRDPTAAQVRGDIQAGKTGDIRQGFDPAAAPLETDGEAAGTPLSSEQARLAIKTQRSLVGDDQTDFDTAMRAPGSMKTVPQGKVSAGFLVRLIGSLLVST
ncbi:hypothetical protein G8E10_22965 [Rhizobiaceae bacterium CRRU44]|uniref:Uncharacterized protein n=1 Tax=Ferranicluibacter rubi TaxID=2715133 RepID=A0AA43ZKA0_9HYPH|nr:hypothetical protein [Ferranicluibacter rubi]NHT78570.1 hypothetical protein [Ferranicluibacter rubi]